MLPRLLIGIILGAVLVRLLIFAVLLPRGESAFWLADTTGYMLIANNLLAGNGYSMATTSPYLPDGMRTPVLPLALAATKALFATPVPYVLLQIAMTGGIVFFTYRIALAVTRRQRLALVAAALMAFEPYSVFISMSLLTETLFALTSTAAAYCMIVYVERRRLAALAAASALFAIAAMTRPVSQFMPILLAMLVCYVERPRAWAKPLAATILPFLIVASPWLLRNHVAFGIAGFSTGGFQNVYSNIGASIVTLRDGGSWDDAKDALEADFAARHGIPVVAIQQDLTVSPLLFREGIAIMLANPVQAIQSFLAVALTFLTSDVWTYYPQHWGWMAPFEYGFAPTKSLFTDGPFVTIERILENGGPALIVAVVGRLFWVLTELLLALGLWILMRERGNRRTFGIIIAVSILYHLGLTWSVGDGVNGRYRYPLNPLIMSAAVLGASALVSRLRSMLRLRERL